MLASLSRFGDKPFPLALFRAGLASLLTSFCIAPALAEEPVEGPPPERNPGAWSVTSENDLFGGTDRNYSNGLRIELVRPANKVTPALKWVADNLPIIDLERTELRQGFALSQTIFTPEDISRVTPDPKDRPYAGWLYFSGTAVATTGNTQDVLQVNLGIVGPSAGAQFVQENWHALIGADEPRGWDSQLKDEPGIEITGQRLYKQNEIDLPFGLKADSALHTGITLGNVRTYAAIGSMARIGFDLEADFGPPRIRPALAGAGVFNPNETFGGYLFAGIEGRAIARDIFLDGNTWRDSPSVEDRRDFVGDLQAGIALHAGDVQVAFTFVHRTEEFVAQDGPQRFGAVSISIAR